MEIQEIAGFKVTGFSVRTQNSDEMDPNTAKIGHLWEKFYSEAFAKLTPESNVYGVYTHYDSDFMGMFDVIACTNTPLLDELNEVVKAEVEPGKYLTFSAQGEMPQAVINLWGDIWAYFDSSDCAHARAYTADFEYYKSENEVEISIAIK